MTTKSYLLVHDFDTRPNTFIRVGHILSDATDPLSTLNADTHTPPPPSTITTTTKSGFSATRSQVRSGKIDIWAQILENATAGASVNSSNTKHDVYSIEKVETEFMWLAPKAAKDYMKGSVEGKEVSEYLEGARYKKAVFMITGVKVAKGVKSVSSKDNGKKGGNVKVMVDATSMGVPVKVGPEAEMKNERVSDTAFMDSEDFVFAYQLRKIMCSKKKVVKDEAYLKGATFDANGKKSGEIELEIEVAEEDLDSVDMEDAEVIRVYDEEAGEDYVCIIVKADD